ncbi:hypothetical protein BK133_18845 [Paenibacillus sp. FSL H8-0548]|uniref:hypothetical protein n=1 Tax=Paenibacillus sp. FSL H8-0548 TaxID=1920422 RepID=UPI00096DADF7|nr:hypothetical protein [Paenibacillus sp. FSL H8-0548]OMF28075.1 hypothetical protein BK133_18845 [Paenibacillus sp. FSL H8-0548]
MDKQEIILFIMEEYEYFKDESGEQLKAGLLRIFNYKGGLTAEALQCWNDSDLSQLYHIVSGMRLTRLYVPNIIEVYEGMDRDGLPSRVSFGSIVNSEPLQKEPRIHRQYGKYDVPPTINRLYELEAELGRDMDMELGLLMQKYDFRYHCTPPDFIPFASPGVDGIHYCFVTDFGTVKDLEQAYIAAVSPMDIDSEIWIVAKNITDFLRILCTDRSVLYYNGSTLDVYFQSAKEQELQQEKQQLSPALQRLKAVFELNEIPDLFEYMQSVREARNKEICIQTLDTIGVMPLLLEQSRASAAEPFFLDWEDEQSIMQLLLDASPEVKLAIIRDAQHMKLLMNDNRLLKSCERALKELGLYHELYNLRELID